MIQGQEMEPKLGTGEGACVRGLLAGAASFSVGTQHGDPTERRQKNTLTSSSRPQVSRQRFSLTEPNLKPEGKGAFMWSIMANLLEDRAQQKSGEWIRRAR